jgi:hypothetical protein
MKRSNSSTQTEAELLAAMRVDARIWHRHYQRIDHDIDEPAQPTAYGVVEHQTIDNVQHRRTRRHIAAAQRRWRK